MTTTKVVSREELWKEMVRRSFNPREWFVEGERPEAPEGTIMWVYRMDDKREGYVVGFYAPNREWHQDSAFPCNIKGREEAVRRVNFLNGGPAVLQN
jgi:hypothetical protein